MPCTVVAIDVDGALAVGESDGSFQVCAVIVEGFIERDSGVVIDLSLVELEDGASECNYAFCVTTLSCEWQTNTYRC